MQPTPASTYDNMMAGPAYREAADPVSTKMPAPIMAPIPNVIKLTGPRARFRLCSPVSPASFISVSIDFVANKGLPMQLLLLFVRLNLSFDYACRRDHIQYTGTPRSTIAMPSPAVCVWYSSRTTIIPVAATIYKSGSTGYPNAL